jgi:predicted Zn-dependent protease
MDARPGDTSASALHATLGGMVAMSKRLDYLLKLTREQGTEKADPFAWYGLAMEYRSLERYDDALSTFEALRARTPDYVPMYLMCGQMLEKVGRLADARAWLSAGADQARKRGDAHALGELDGALEALG